MVAPDLAFGPEVQQDMTDARVTGRFPSPIDWRKHWIYFIMIDRFDNPNAAPRFQWNNGSRMDFQGGVFEGIRQRLGYLHGMGVGVLWLTPALKNCQYTNGTYHGYGIQDFLAIDSRFATNPAQVESELQALICDAHQLNPPMYVIFDVVLHHAGDVFTYDGFGEIPAYRAQKYPVMWRDSAGVPRWTDPVLVAGPNPRDAVVWPRELHNNALFEERGVAPPLVGDFSVLRAVEQEDGMMPALQILIRTYKDIIAKYDVDGFRIDTLKYISPQASRVFANAIREFARTIGKDNFFLFGEVWDSEEEIARFIGRDTKIAGVDEPLGVDAALDFPLFYQLPWVCKGLLPPSEVVRVYQKRKGAERTILSTHGDASGFFITFLDNHDQKERFYYSDPANPHQFNDQVTLALGCLFSLPGIPCVYYGTEQGLSGRGGTLEAVREALWGKPGNPFDQNHPFYQALWQLSLVRRNNIALCSGRYYFRPISGDRRNFGISSLAPGVLAFSRILDDQEIVVIANTQPTQPWNGEVIIDSTLNSNGDVYQILYSNKNAPAAPRNVVVRGQGTVTVREPEGYVTNGPLTILPVNLQPMEVQILRK